MSASVFRIHPAIGLARVGNSEEYYLGPETPAGVPLEGGNPKVGGLPIKPGTEADTITSKDLRDTDGALKRQAARFRIYRYPADGPETYPRGDGTEVRLGSTVDGRKVKDVIWTVHLANKKANWYQSDDDRGVKAYDDGETPPPRNPDGQGSNPDNPDRIKRLVIDPGPRAVRGAASGPVRFDRATTASFWKSGDAIETIAPYPKSFPSDAFPELDCPSGAPITTLGELRTDEQGRLLVLGAHGVACGWSDTPGQPAELNDDVNNNHWFDDVADGPVSAVLVFDDGSVQEVQGGAWVITTDPGYAPQIRNAITLWDDIFDSFVRKLGLMPELFSSPDPAGAFNPGFQPSFEEDVRPMFRSAALQRWITNLDPLAIGAHADVDEIGAGDDPDQTLLGGLGLIRDPSQMDEQSADDRRMPLSLGDSGESFLSLTRTQYFFLQQWNAKKATGDPPKLGPGEALDRAVLVNCLGGRFSPGIDMTWICREPDLYVQDWRTSGRGPFRIRPRKLSYGGARPGQPLLTGGYTPRRSGAVGLEPGDVSKFMAIPWHTDYNSCATHTLRPNPRFNNTLYWSWPAQRPVAVYVADPKDGGKLPTKQSFSVRGPGTLTDHPAELGRYQVRRDIIRNWPRIGVVLQGSALDGGTYDPEHFLEAESRMEEGGDPVRPFPNTVPPGSG